VERNIFGEFGLHFWSEIITNDAGIGRGQSYVYDENVLWNAIHDWNGGDVIHGEKLMIVIEPKK
jgi:hypothetical protein